MPIREERRLTAARLAALPETRPPSRPPQRPATCACGTCTRCLRRLYTRFYRSGAGSLGRWSSSRARAVRDERLATGASWAELAQRYGYANADSARKSAAYVTRSESARERLRRAGRAR